MTPRLQYAVFVVALLAACDDRADYYPRQGYPSSESSGGPEYSPPWPSPDSFPKPPQGAEAKPFGPEFGSTITQTDPPPALGGATVIVAADGRTAIASDPDRDRVVLVDVPTRGVRSVVFDKGSEPGRITEDANAHAHVALRGAGAIATIDLGTGTITSKRAACAAPRGVTIASSTLYVACAGGELVALPASGGDATIVTRLDPDLRDIIAFEDRLVVSRFRSAEILTVDLQGKLLSRQAPPPRDPGTAQEREPSVAWRMVRRGDGVQVVHQVATKKELFISQPSAYAGSSGGCSGPIVTTTTIFTSAGAMNGPTFADAVLPIDVALSKDASHYALIAAGNGHFSGLSQVHFSGSSSGCTTQFGVDPNGQLVAAAFLPNDVLIVLSREPAALYVRDRQGTDPWSTIALGGASREDTGHAIFHTNSAQGGLACASCHPEGADDGRTWKFFESVNGSNKTISRRTPSLRGTLQDTAPFHWKGELPDLAALAKASWSGRMGGPSLSSAQIGALETWSLKIPTVPVSPADTAAVERGKTVFERSQCTSCHSGARFTNNASADVGAGEAFQVPSLLGLKVRAPYMHDGCAKTALDAFGTSCGSAHGQTSSLTSAQLSDLGSYLESL